MAADIKTKYGSNNQTITITIDTLAASATVGRASTAIDNRTNLFLDALVSGKVNVGVVSGNKQVLVYAYGTADDGTNYSGENGANTISGTDAAFTRADPTDLKLIGVIPCPTASIDVGFGPYSVAQAFGGVLPALWGICIFNDTGVAFITGSSAVRYQGVLAQSV